MEETLDNWLEDNEVRKDHHSLVGLIIWVVWLTWKEFYSNPKSSIIHGNTIYLSYHEVNKKVKKTRIEDPQIITTSTYGFFDGVANKLLNLCSIGGLFHVQNIHKICFECGLGAGTKNLAKFKEKTILMSISREEKLLCIHIDTFV
jgi:hypothetical protein